MRPVGSEEVTEERAAAQLSELLSSYHVSVSSYHLRKLFQEKWTTLTTLAHALHDAQERRCINAKRKAAAELYSPEHEDKSG